MAITLDTLEDTPAVAATRQKQDVDLTPYRELLHTLFLAPAGTKVIPVSMSGERGEGLQTVRKRFLAAQSTMGESKNKEGKVVYDPKKIKLIFRNSEPGNKKPTKVYVKWAPKED